ncbi:MAG: DNA polymerase III subunit beta [Phycisphaerales bacterium]|nr:DNA polymerase III subunit beta [Phycisphaerales bacterium]
MKVICDRAALVDAVTLVGSVVVGRTPSPVLKCIHLKTEQGVLTLAATDLEVAIRLGIDAVDIESEGEVVVPADKLTQIVRACDDPTLTIEKDDHAVHIRGENSHFKVFGFDPREFPAVNGFGDASVTCTITGAGLATLISRTLFAAASEHSRYAINGVLFDRHGGKLRLVATDGRRLAMANGKCDGPEGDSSCIVPIKALSLVSKLLPHDETVVRIAITDNQIMVAVGEGETAPVLTSNLVEGAFPPFEDVIPKDQDKKGLFDAHALSSAVRRAALLTNEESRGVRMSFKDSTLTLTSRAPEMGEAEIQLAALDYTGDPLDIGFNPQYVTDALKVLDNDQVLIELKAPSKPGVLRIGTDFMYVLMPVNLQ